MLLGLPSSHLDKQGNKKGCLNVAGAAFWVCGWNLTHAVRVGLVLGGGGDGGIYN